MGMNLSKLWEIVGDREAWSAAVHGDAKRWTWLNDWATTTTNIDIYTYMLFICLFLFV